MSFAQRFALVLLAAFFLSSIASSLAALLCAAPVLRRSTEGAARLRARALALFRLLPACTALAITLLVLAPGYYAYEQRSEPENTGLLLALSAAGGALILLSSMVRAGRALAHTARLRRSWMRKSRPIALPAAGIPAFEIDVPFPLVAVLGALRPRLFISSSVLRACTPAEITAIVEHERSHVSAADNVMRLLMDAAPDALALTALPLRIAGAWHHAIEHRADDAAARKLDLASALLRVTRLAQAPQPVMLPASALYRGEGVEDRVRRLAAPVSGRAQAPWTAAVGAAAAMLAVALVSAAASDSALALAHALLEAAVSLP